MSQIASFYLLKDGQRRELSDGDCSGDVYMAIWDYCEDELGIDCRFNAPRQTMHRIGTYPSKCWKAASRRFSHIWSW